jgi:hypothetical protein
VSRNLTAPLTYSFVRPQAAGDDAVFAFASALDVVDFVVLESPVDLAVEPLLERFEFAVASDAADSARDMMALIRHDLSSRAESA